MSNSATMRPHEILREIINYVQETPAKVRSEIEKSDPRGFACSASLKRLRGIILKLDKLDPKYDDSLKLTDPSLVQAGDSINLDADIDAAMAKTLADAGPDPFQALQSTPQRKKWGRPFFFVK